MVQNGRISDFHGLLTLTLTLDPGMVITFFHLSSSTCIPNFIEIKETFCGRTDERTDGNLPPIVLGRLPKFGSRPKNHFITAVSHTQVLRHRLHAAVNIL